jgi:hypothetical protein
VVDQHKVVKVENSETLRSSFLIQTFTPAAMLYSLVLALAALAISTI